MKKEELLKLGFVDTSIKYEIGTLKQFTLKINRVTTIETYDLTVDIFIFDQLINVPNCKTIDDMKRLIKLFS